MLTQVADGRITSHFTKATLHAVDIGVPPVVFAPCAALIVKANYTGAVEPPRTPSEGTLAPWKPRVLGPWEEAGAWCLLAAWIACAVAGISWFWRFSRE